MLSQYHTLYCPIFYFLFEDSDALIYFEKCWEIGVPNGDKKESYDLVENMQRLYKNVGNESKEAEMKELKETILTK